MDVEYVFVAPTQFFFKVFFFFQFFMFFLVLPESPSDQHLFGLFIFFVNRNFTKVSIFVKKFYR